MIRWEREWQVEDECLPSYTVLSKERCIVKIRYITSGSARYTRQLLTSTCFQMCCVGEIGINAEDDLGFLDP
jgi:hypothetical protein